MKKKIHLTDVYLATSLIPDLKMLLVVTSVIEY